MLKQLAETASLLHRFPFDVNLWKVQNSYYGMMNSLLADHTLRAGQGDPNAQEWVAQFSELGRHLNFHVPQ